MCHPSQTDRLTVHPSVSSSSGAYKLSETYGARRWRFQQHVDVPPIPRLFIWLICQVVKLSTYWNGYTLDLERTKRDDSKPLWTVADHTMDQSDR